MYSECYPFWRFANSSKNVNSFFLCLKLHGQHEGVSTFCLNIYSDAVCRCHVTVGAVTALKIDLQ